MTFAFDWSAHTTTKGIPIGALSQRPLPKSAFNGEELKVAIIWSLNGSTGKAETSWFHGLSGGKISTFSASAIVALQELPGEELSEGAVLFFLQLKSNKPQQRKIQ